MKRRLDKVAQRRVFVKGKIFNSRQTDTNTKSEICRKETDQTTATVGAADITEGSHKSGTSGTSTLYILVYDESDESDERPVS